MKSLHVDVLVVGAGLSGVGAACRLTQLSPDRSFAVLESREAGGGTWDLFRYPGVRTDSDVHTFGYPFRPWTGTETLASGESIRTYIRETATEFGIDEHIHYGQRVISAAFSWETGRWSVRAETVDGLIEHTATFLYVCTGYYSYDTGHVVDFPGRAEFDGPIIHPQFWPEAFDPAGKRIVVIGSGATAVTLVPALAERGAAHVTMLQRSPGYVLPIPGRDPVGRGVGSVLRGGAGERLGQRLVRAKNLLQNVGVYELSRRFPRATRRGIAALNRRFVGEEAVREHFTPRYEPWDQRMCFVPDADFLKVVGDGRASVVTDTVDRFTATGIRVAGGEELEADAIVTATGLRIEIAGGITFTHGGQVLDPSAAFFYKGAMFGGAPNLAVCLGYTNNSWTLRADLTSRFVCAVLNELRDRGAATATPRLDPDLEEGERPFELTSTYLERSRHLFPRQGTVAPWTVRQNYFHDRRLMSSRRVDDGVLEFAPLRPRGVDPKPLAAAADRGAS
ncbi:flavin-containing monooxygenase [Knoellia subterranea]|uniref:FAD-containing monooxygenase EthA n=1 Tax=Knoellia subterranea KCTC 19937 TaxID=1385521 RepID=A0A0A0JG73_9MICO|nr:NAD(P)/FAD-dependent oxidoreductase [Knoellia subterranea]KGN36128.1 FAD-containing monooxygenase EthA [Knoellia subterranea KCTC 19937]